MSDPNVTKVVDKDGVERWGAAGAKWAADAQPQRTETGAASGPVAPAVQPETQEASDVAEVPADGDRSDPKPRKR